MALCLGHSVSKVGGDYKFDGIIVAKFFKLDGKSERFVVEDDRGVLHIYSERNLKLKGS